MKQLVFIGALLVVLGTIWVLFLEHEKERFERSLPQVPQTVAPQPQKDTNSSQAERDDVSETSAGTLISEDTTAETSSADTARSQEAAESETTFLAPPSLMETKSTSAKCLTNSPRNFKTSPQV